VSEQYGFQNARCNNKKNTVSCFVRQHNYNNNNNNNNNILNYICKNSKYKMAKYFRQDKTNSSIKFTVSTLYCVATVRCGILLVKQAAVVRSIIMLTPA
jgi:hypothetical protein